MWNNYKDNYTDRIVNNILGRQIRTEKWTIFLDLTNSYEYNGNDVFWHTWEVENK